MVQIAYQDCWKSGGVAPAASPSCVGEVLFAGGQQRLDLLLGGGHLLLQESDLVQQRPQFERSHPAQLGQPERLACRGLHPLGFELPQLAAAGLLEQSPSLVQISLSELRAVVACCNSARELLRNTSLNRLSYAGKTRPRMVSSRRLASPIWSTRPQRKRVSSRNWRIVSSGT